MASIQEEREQLLAQGYIKRIHVDQHVIRAHGDSPVTVQTSKGPLKGKEVIVLGPSRIIYRPENPLSCGARLWIETHAAVEVL